MKKKKINVLFFIVLAAVVLSSGFAMRPSENKKSNCIFPETMNQQINMLVSHGHCSTPFTGVVDSLKVITSLREDQGNPMEDMDISFELDPHSFHACAGEEFTKRIQTKGLFFENNHEKITFKTTEVHTLGLDWYQIDGKLSIKGVERKVSLLASGIRDPRESMTTALVVSGKMNLLDWGIDYDKIVHGQSDSVPNKWLYLNMQVDLTKL